MAPDASKCPAPNRLRRVGRDELASLNRRRRVVPFHATCAVSSLVLETGCSLAKGCCTIDVGSDVTGDLLCYDSNE